MYTIIKIFRIGIIFISYPSSIHCQKNNNPPGTIYTCCALQSSLAVSEGYCNQPTSEFDFMTFESEWKVPKSLINTNALDLQQDFKLQARHPFCICESKGNTINIQFVNDSEGQLIPKNAIPDGFSINQNAEMLLNGKLYKNSNYCLNKIIENTIENVPTMDIEIVVCTESCQDEFKQPKTTSKKVYNKVVASNCNNWATDNCSWAVFYENDEKFYFVNATSDYYEDHSYPWGSLPENTYCQELDTGFIKFCITEIKKLFYDYQEIYAILVGISAIFLLFNLTIYFSLRESLSISGWTECLYSLALYTYCVLSIPGLLITPDSAEIRHTCYALSVLIQFFELANGATLVALSFDILWTFCKHDKKGYTDDPKVSKLRLSIYVIFSLAFPLAVVSYGLAKNHRPWDFKFDDHSGFPQYGLFHCTAPDWPMSSYTQFGMQGVNLLLALISAYVILNKQRLEETKEYYSLDSDRLDIFSKLFVYVFVFWIVDFMQFFLEDEHFSRKWYVVAFRVINYSQGIFAFFILVCNRQTLRGIRHRDWNMKNLFYHACCTCSKSSEKEDVPEEAPLSPLMKGTSMRRSTVRGNTFY